MKQLFLTLCKRTFEIGFVVSGIAFFIQGFSILNTGHAQNISLITFILFTLLNINASFYGYYLAKDKLLMIGTIFSGVGSLSVIILKLIYG